MTEKEMLKAPVVMENGNVVYPEKGTPQGGILSQLLANIVLNELDWWVSGQWETIPTKTAKTKYKKDGSMDNSKKYTVLRNNSNLKEMYIVRYADDFKIFCRKRNEADKVFIAVNSDLAESGK